MRLKNNYTCGKCGCYVPDKMEKCPACGADSVSEKRANNTVTFELDGKTITARIINIEYEEIEGALSGRIADGTLIRHVLTTKRKFLMIEQ